MLILCISFNIVVFFFVVFLFHFPFTVPETDR